MVSKLLKYDISSVLRTIIPLNVIILAFSVFIRVFELLEIDHDLYYNLLTTVKGVFYLFVIVCCALTVVIITIRYYKNLFSTEGYLSFTLPVPTTNHLISKLLSAIIVTGITGCVMLLSELIMNDEYSIISIIINFLTKYGIGECFFVIESILLFIIFVISTYLIIFACISIGQTLPGNRILIATVLFFGYFFLTLIVKIFIFIVFLTKNGITENVYSIIVQIFGYGSFEHVLPIGMIIFKIIMCVIYFCISRYMIKNHLNLE